MVTNRNAPVMRYGQQCFCAKVNAIYLYPTAQDGIARSAKLMTRIKNCRDPKIINEECVEGQRHFHGCVGPSNFPVDSIIQGTAAATITVSGSTSWHHMGVQASILYDLQSQVG